MKRGARFIVRTVLSGAVAVASAGVTSASGVNSAVTGAAGITCALSSFFFPIFGQCLEVSIAIHVGAANILKGVSQAPLRVRTTSASPDHLASCSPPAAPNETFSSCPAWPPAVPASVATLLGQATQLEVDLIEDSRAIADAVGPYYSAISINDLGCANTLYSFMSTKVTHINQLADQLSSVYATAAQNMRNSGTDASQPIANFNNFMNSLRANGYPSEDLSVMPQIHTRTAESDMFLSLMNGYTNAELLQLGGLPGATSIKFSDGLQAGANAYAAYNPILEVQPPPVPNATPGASTAGMIVVAAALGLASLWRLRQGLSQRGTF